MKDYPQDIYTEPDPDVDTLANLGPLTGMAGIWTGTRGVDVNPKAEGPETQVFIERMELQPSMRRPMGRSCFTACVTTRRSSSPTTLRHSTTRSVTGCGSRPPAP